MSLRVKLDIIACDGRGVCAELLPERITLDDWGYPIVDPSPVSGEVLEHAKRAIAACPVLALRLERFHAPAAAPGPVARR
jgi:ferredoxin